MKKGDEHIIEGKAYIIDKVEYDIDGRTVQVYLKLQAPIYSINITIDMDKLEEESK